MMSRKAESMGAQDRGEREDLHSGQGGRCKWTQVLDRQASGLLAPAQPGAMTGVSLLVSGGLLDSCQEWPLGGWSSR